VRIYFLFAFIKQEFAAGKNDVLLASAFFSEARLHNAFSSADCKVPDAGQHLRYIFVHEAQAEEAGRLAVVQ